MVSESPLIEFVKGKIRSHGLSGRLPSALASLDCPLQNPQLLGSGRSSTSRFHCLPPEHEQTHEGMQAAVHAREAYCARHGSQQLVRPA